MPAVLDAPVIQVKDLWVPDALDEALRHWNPRNDIGRFITAVAHELPDREMAAELIERFSKVVILSSSLSLRVFRSKQIDVPWNVFNDWQSRIEDYGLVGDRVITNNGVGYLVDAWQNSVELENQKYHGLGTGSTAENQTDSALVTELTTEYTGDVRATGTTTEGASANIFKTVGTNTLDGTPGAALREHGIFSASTAGVLWDRTVYAAITLSSGDALESTYQMTASANG